jgi:MFS family permease
MYNKKLVFSAACLGMLLFGIVLISLGSILPSVTAKFSLDEISVGTLASILPFGILAGSLVFGPIADRYGYKNLLIICSVLVLLGLEGIAFAASVFMLQISMLLIGFGGGVINGGTNALVADISTDEKGASLSYLGVFFGIGALGMPAVLGLLSKSFPETNIIAGIGLFVLIPVIFFISINFPVPKQSQGFPIKEGINLIKESLLLIFGFVLFFESGMEGIVNNWTTTYLIRELKINPENALFALSYFVAGMTVTRLLLGSILKKMPPYVVMFLCLTVAFIGTLIMIYSSSYTAAVIALILLGIGFAAGFPLTLGYVGEIYSALSGTAFSIVLVIALIGNMLLNYLVGLISHSYGIKQFTTLLIICIVLMSIILSLAVIRVKRGIDQKKIIKIGS